MSNRSNAIGRAYEYACVIALYKSIRLERNVEIIKDSTFKNAKNEWESQSLSMRRNLAAGAQAIIKILFELEPMIVENSDDVLSLKLQEDKEGETGDVRDLLIIRSSKNWEVGLSLKHNHFAVKHSRLSMSIDFGKKWYGIECSKYYWNTISPIFNLLKQYKDKCKKWSEIPNKALTVYIPILNAFKDEIERVKANSEVPQRLVEYLLGKFDFYKVISVDKSKTTLLYSYNLRGMLNKPSGVKKSDISLPVALLPTRIVAIEMKPNSNNTLEMFLDNGWQFSFRIHNASTKVEPSLKFDIQIIGMPANITIFTCKWIQPL